MLLDDLNIQPACKPDFKRYYDWIGPAIAGAAALGSTIWSTTAASQMNHKSYKRNKKWLDYQTEVNERLYHQYSSPEATMRQYREAGLNPNLIYGQGQISGPDAGTGANAPDYQNPAPDLVRNTSALVTALENVQNRRINQDIADANRSEQNRHNTAVESIMQQNADTNTENKAYDNAYKEAKTKSTWLQTQFQRINNKYIEEYLQGRNRNQELRNIYQEGANAIQNYRMAYQLEIETAQMEVELENMIKQGYLTDDQIRVARANIGVLQTTAKYISAQTEGQQLKNAYQEAVNEFQPFMQVAELNDLASKTRERERNSMLKEIDTALNPYGKGTASSLMNYVHRSMNRRTINRTIKKYNQKFGY